MIFFSMCQKTPLHASFKKKTSAMYISYALSFSLCVPLASLLCFGLIILYKCGEFGMCFCRLIVLQFPKLAPKSHPKW